MRIAPMGSDALALQLVPPVFEPEGWIVTLSRKLTRNAYFGRFHPRFSTRRTPAKALNRQTNPRPKSTSQSADRVW
jgi:hypothetical protein